MRGGIRIEWDHDEQAHVAHYHQHRYRFLLSTGDTIDVLAHRDDSELREAIIEWAITKQGTAISIEGVATVQEGGG